MPPSGDVHDQEQRRRVLRAVYGDAMRSPDNPDGWIDEDRIDVEIEALLKVGEAAQAERFFLNRCAAGSTASTSSRSCS